MYNFLTHHQNPKLYAVLQYQRTTSFDFLLLARNLLIDGEAHYLHQVLELESKWRDLPGHTKAAYPFRFSAEERKQIEADVEGAMRGMELM